MYICLQKHTATLKAIIGEIFFSQTDGGVTAQETRTSYPAKTEPPIGLRVSLKKDYLYV